MYSLNFKGRTLDSILDTNVGNSDRSSVWGSTVGVVLCTGGIPPGDVPEFNLGMGTEATADFTTNLLSVFESSVACMTLSTKQVKSADGDHYIEFKPVSAEPIHTYGWTARNARWERYPDLAKITKGVVEEQHGNSALDIIKFPSDGMNAKNTGHLYYTPRTTPEVEDRDVEFELSTKTEIRVEKIDLYVLSSYPISLEYWDSTAGDWVMVDSEIAIDYSGILTLDEPVTTSKWRIKGTTQAVSHYVRIRKLMFISETKPTFEPAQTVTHAYILPKRYTQSTYTQFKESFPTVMVSVGDLTSSEPLILLDLEVGDNKEAQFISMALTIEELESDKV